MHFNVDEKTIETHVRERYGANFSDVSRRFRKTGVVSLRRKSFQVALAGNPSMLKHLLNNYGGLSDRLTLMDLETAKRELAEVLGVSPDELPG